MAQAMATRVTVAIRCCFAIGPQNSWCAPATFPAQLDANGAAQPKNPRMRNARGFEEQDAGGNSTEHPGNRNRVWRDAAARQPARDSI
jgi:hypothetical protein